MMVIEQYGVRLVRLGEEDIELVRYWRNHHKIARYMQYQEEITPEMQVKWFNSVNNKYNYYFIIEFEGKKVGLINSKDYDPEKGFGEGGIFMWDKDHSNSFAAVFATLCLLNFVFFKLKACTLSRARILRSNHRAIHYNKLIGYKLLPGQDEVENQLYELTVEDYIKNATRLNNAAMALNEGKSELIFRGPPSARNLDVMNRLLEKQAPAK